MSRELRILQGELNTLRHTVLTADILQYLGGRELHTVAQLLVGIPAMLPLDVLGLAIFMNTTGYTGIRVGEQRETVCLIDFSNHATPNWPLWINKTLQS